jgi:hypothetical protein
MSNISGLRGNCLADNDTEILRVRKQELLKMSEDEICSKLGSVFDANPFIIFKVCIYEKIFSAKINFVVKKKIVLFKCPA